MFCEWLKTFLSRIRANFFENPTINKKGTPLNQNWHFLKNKTGITLLILTNQNKVLFMILTNQNTVLRIKIKQSLENSRERVFQGQL